MSSTTQTTMVLVRELLAWNLDEYPYRDEAIAGDTVQLAKKMEYARANLVRRAPYEPRIALLNEKTRQLHKMLAPQAHRADLEQEYKGLDWSIGIVDLRCLLAFQRRLVFDPALPTPVKPQQEDWSALHSLCFAPPRSTEYRVTAQMHSDKGLDITLQSANPDLHLHLAEPVARNAVSSLVLYGGSPFFEVAEYRGRWFLRDGYHRAYYLLQAGIHSMVAIIIRARTIDELGATQPWFFCEDLLFSDCPPQVTDFLDDSLVVNYNRPRLTKTIRIQIEECLQPSSSVELTSDELQGETA